MSAEAAPDNCHQSVSLRRAATTYCSAAHSTIASVSSNTLTIAWPADHIGWILQAQTNGLSTGQWFDLPGSDVVNAVVIPIYPANTSVFYRQRMQ